ncbi:hypothetical protein SAMN05216480_101603 [Pustulibacterium marinum]|uniref:Glycoamylase-like domain-containing protein n=1 Tax=Pustulibacterium marinum TaxID=1224947 RepID=A0A1I7F3M4_9FLAO|nr:glucoamylase family protein [Pustulibacterium marinum]SFU30818.1 hypothetical protein SAMN05216480_101603 [Pustulibacterium marinum]
MKLFVYITCFFVSLSFFSCSKDENVAQVEESPDPVTPTPDPEISDEDLMDYVQEETFKYFWDLAESNSGGARERYVAANPSQDAHVVTTGGTGFGLMAILVGVERGYVTRSEAVTRLNTLLTFLENADRFHGAWPHWLHGETGAVLPFSTNDDGVDLVETSFLAQGLICIKEYFKSGTEEEIALANKADELWKGVEWNWFTQNQNILYWHWSPNNGWAMNLPITGYNECLITYVMAASSPNYAIDSQVYTEGWASSGTIVSGNVQYDYPLLVKHQGNESYGGPLFWAHYSYLGLDPRNLSDSYANYWNVNVNHSMINYLYCVENPMGYTHYGEDFWGLTASYSRNADGSLGYSAHTPTNDLGIVSPTAAISSIPYTPEESLAAMHYFYLYDDILTGEAGFYDAFSPHYNFWVAEAYLAIDQGPQIIMIENYRSGLLWDLFMQNEDIQNGLTNLGFSYE